MSEWQPSTEAEAALRDALRNGDQEMYFRILARIELLLPVSADALAGRAPMGWATWSAESRTHLLAFTSTDAMYACLADSATSARKVTYRQLADEWPNHDWWLAVNPGLPIEGYLPAWFVSQLARGDVRMPGQGAAAQARDENDGGGRPNETVLAAPPLALEAGPSAMSRRSGGARHANSFVPANQVERDLFDAAEAGDTDVFQSVLLLASVLVPITPGADPTLRPRDPGFDWHYEEINGEPFIVVYTSPELAESAPPECELVKCRFTQVIAAWPDERLSFAVNPGTPVGATLPGDQVLALANWALQMGLGTEERKEITPKPSASRSPADDVIDMQKAIAPSQVGYYLDRGYDRVSGFVHRAREVGRLKTPAQVREALGLTWPGSPFAADAEEIFVLRWAAYRPDLYRIPYGGTTEAAMKAMEGWVIERAPFRGNGFAPGESREVIAEFKVDSVRLPHGARLLRLRADGSEDIIAVLDADGPRWLRIGGQLTRDGEADAYVAGGGIHDA